MFRSLSTKLCIQPIIFFTIMKLQIEIPRIKALQAKETPIGLDSSKLDMYFYPAKKQGNRYVPIGSNPIQFHLKLDEVKKENPNTPANYYELNLPDVEAFTCIFALWENFDARNLAEQKKLFQNIDKEDKEIPFHLQLSNTTREYDISFKVIINEEDN